MLTEPGISSKCRGIAPEENPRVAEKVCVRIGESVIKNIQTSTGKNSFEIVEKFMSILGRSSNFGVSS